MFDKLENLPRHADGSLRNEWTELAGHSLILAYMRVRTMITSQVVSAQMDVIWNSFWQPFDPFRMFVEGEQAAFAERAFRDARPSDAGKPEIQRDLDAAIQAIQEIREDGSP